MHIVREKFSLLEKICLSLNKRFKPFIDLEVLKENPSQKSRAEYSYRSALSNFEKSLDFMDLSPDENKNILDLGCGFGGMVAVLSKKYYGTVTGLDNEIKALSSAKEFLSTKPGKSEKTLLVLSSADTMPFPSNTFSRIYTIATMEHFEDPEKVLNECYRILQRYGRIYIIFSPYYTYSGAHLFDLINIPWCHLIFPEKTLIKVWKRMARENPDLAKLNPVVDLENNQLTGINKMSIRFFKKILKKSRFKVIKYQENTFDRWYCKPLQKLPLVKELLTKEILVSLSKEDNNLG